MHHEPLEWNQSFELDVKEIDFQHQYFVALINRLQHELREQTNAEYRANLIAELNAYAKFHFVSEENLMRKANYPDLEVHRQHHFDLINSLGVKGGLLQVDYSDASVDKIIDFLIDWFKHHTVSEDRRFADFLNSQSPDAQPTSNAS